MKKKKNLVFNNIISLSIILMLTLTLLNTNQVMATTSVGDPSVTQFQVIRGNNQASYSGTTSFSLPIGTVKGRGGISVPLAISYSPGIRTHQEPTTVGLGWNFGIGAITRGIVNFADDETIQGNYLKNNVKSYCCVVEDLVNTGFPELTRFCTNANAIDEDGICQAGELKETCNADTRSSSQNWASETGNTCTNYEWACTNKNTNKVEQTTHILNEWDVDADRNGNADNDPDNDGQDEDTDWYHCQSGLGLGTDYEVKKCKGLTTWDMANGEDYCVPINDEPSAPIQKQGTLDKINNGPAAFADEGNMQDNYFANFPGGAAPLMFYDDNGQAKFIPKQWKAWDIQTEDTNANGDIDKWIITTSEGIQYHFGTENGDTPISNANSYNKDYYSMETEDHSDVYTEDEIAILEPNDVGCTGTHSYNDYLRCALSDVNNPDCEPGITHPVGLGICLATDEKCLNNWAGSESWIAPYPYTNFKGTNTDPTDDEHYSCGDKVNYKYTSLNAQDPNEVPTGVKGAANVGQYQTSLWKSKLTGCDIKLVSTKSQGCYSEDADETEPKIAEFTGKKTSRENSAAAWYLTEIRSSNYRDTNSNGPSSEDFGQWAKINYEKYDQNYGDKADYVISQEEANGDPWFYYNPFKDNSQNCVAYPYSQPGQCSFSPELNTRAVHKIGTEQKSDLIRISSVETPLQIAYFQYTEEEGEVAQLDEITINDKATNQRISRIEFTYATGDSNDRELKAPNGESFGQRTLTKVQFFGDTDSITQPAWTFDYGDRSSSTENPVFDSETYGDKGLQREYTDPWGYYTDEVDWSVDPDGSAEAWSIKEITAPTGGSIEYEYENNAYEWSPKQSATGNCPAVESDCWFQHPTEAIGGGIRVKKVTTDNNLNGFQGSRVETSYEYEGGVATQTPADTHAGWSITITNDPFTGESATQPYGMPWAFLGQASRAYVAYDKITTKSPIDGTKGYTITNYLTPYESPDTNYDECVSVLFGGTCVGGFLTDNDRTRGLVESTEIYNSQGELLTRNENTWQESTSYGTHSTQHLFTDEYGNQPTHLYGKTKDIESSQMRLTQTETKEFYHGPTIEEVTKKTKYCYDNTNGKVWRTIELGDEYNRVSEVEFAYNTQTSSVNQAMLDANMLSPTYRTKIYQHDGTGEPSCTSTLTLPDYKLLSMSGTKYSLLAANVPPAVTLNNPLISENFPTTTGSEQINFDCSATDTDGTIQTMNLYTDTDGTWSIKHTTSNTNLNHNINVNVATTPYNWACEAIDNQGKSTITPTRTFSVTNPLWEEDAALASGLMEILCEQTGYDGVNDADWNLQGDAAILSIGDPYTVALSKSGYAGCNSGGTSYNRQINIYDTTTQSSANTFTETETLPMNDVWMIRYADFDMDGVAEEKTGLSASYNWHTLAGFYTNLPVIGSSSLGSYDFGDIDDDGDIDFVYTWKVNGGRYEVRYYENTETPPANNPVWASEYTTITEIPQPPLGTHPSISLEDINLDGSLEIFTDKAYSNEQGTWIEKPTLDSGVSTMCSDSCAKQFADLDDDGDQDLVCSCRHIDTYPSVLIYENTHCPGGAGC